LVLKIKRLLNRAAFFYFVNTAKKQGIFFLTSQLVLPIFLLLLTEQKIKEQ